MTAKQSVAVDVGSRTLRTSIAPITLFSCSSVVGVGPPKGHQFGASQSVMSRLENDILGTTAGRQALDTMITRSADALLRKKNKKRLIIDVDSTEDPAHGNQDQMACKDLVREVFSKRTKKLDSSRYWNGLMVFWALAKQISALKRENLIENWQIGMRNWFFGKSVA